MRYAIPDGLALLVESRGTSGAVFCQFGSRILANEINRRPSTHELDKGVPNTAALPFVEFHQVHHGSNELKASGLALVRAASIDGSE